MKAICSFETSEEITLLHSVTYLPIRRAIKQIVVIIGHITFANYAQNFSNILLTRLTPYAEEMIVFVKVDFDATG